MSGRGTASGVGFQAQIGAAIAGLILAERDLSRLRSGLPGRPSHVRFETPTAVDDLQILTDRGHVFVQAKTTLSLSPKPGSELASVADQFVRQFRAGITEQGVRRDLSPASDRLLLVVGDRTGTPISHDLQDALDRNRTGAATGLPSNLAAALDCFTTHIANSWLGAAGVAITSHEKESLLKVSAVSVFGDAQRQIVIDGLRDVVATSGDETVLMDVLEKWAIDASANGTGGDAEAIRLALTDKLNLAGPPSFKADIRKLLAYSADAKDRLRRFTELISPEGAIRLARAVVDVVAVTAPDGSVVVTGDPGAGKSAVLHGVAESLGRHATVITLSVDASAISLDALRAEIGLEHPLPEVLKHLPGGRPAYLILDALDAVRGGQSEATYKRLVELVGDLPGWRVVASVRSFDLRLGREWRRLFSGAPVSADHLDATLSTVRHVHVNQLDEHEKAELARMSPSLGAAIAAGGEKFAELASNPFNLSLLGDLLCTGVAANELAKVATRSELLERYWQERIDEFGLPATVSLTSFVELLVSARSLDLPETKVPVAAAHDIQNILRVGVLVIVNRRLGFRHHVLFDYAVARLLLSPAIEDVFRHLAKDLAAGLLIAPSLSYWLEDTKRRSPAKEYWKVIARLISDPAVDPVARVEVARLAVEAVDDDTPLTALLEVLEDPSVTLTGAFEQLVGALLTKTVAKERFSVEPWARLAGMMSAPKRQQLGCMRALIGIALDAGTSREGMISLGQATRAAFDAMGEDERLIDWLSAHIVPFIARTYWTDIEASRQRLRAILTGERFAKFGYIEVPWLARHVTDIVAHDGDVIIDIYYRVFRGGDFSRDQTTSMSRSWILSLTSTAAQDFHMAAFSLAEAFPKILDIDPLTGMRAFAATLCGERDREHRATGEPEIELLSVGNAQPPFERDDSHVWAWKAGDEDSHDDYAKIYRAFLDWAVRADETALRQAPSVILTQNGMALKWRALFEAGAKRPEVLGEALWAAATSRTALQSEDTRQSVIDFIAAAYQGRSPEQRSEAEQGWLTLSFDKYVKPNAARLRILGILFNAIGENDLMTDASRMLLREAVEQQRSLENNRAFEVHTSWEKAGHPLEEVGVDINAPTISGLVKLIDAVKAALTQARESKVPAAAEVQAVWSATCALWQALDAGGEIDPVVERQASDALAEGLGYSFVQYQMPTSERDRAVQRLLMIAAHPDPQSNAETEARFAEYPSWGTPAPRIQAAWALTKAVRNGTGWQALHDHIRKMVLTDPHPAVRHQLLKAIPVIHYHDTEAGWTLAEQIAATETNAGVIHQLGHCLTALYGTDDDRLERIVLNLAERHPVGKREDALTATIVHFAVVKGTAPSNAKLNDWLARYQQEERRLSDVLFKLRYELVRGLADDTAEYSLIRQRARAFLGALIAAVEPAVCAWPIHGGAPTEQEATGFKILNIAANQLYFSVYHDRELPPWMSPREVQHTFLTENAELIRTFNALGSPATVHHLTELIGKMVPADPELCFDLFSAAMMRATGVGQYQHEGMGAELFVSLVGCYLADYRHLFDDEARRRRLVDCITLFVEAGWPAARRLFHNLPDLLR